MTMCTDQVSGLERKFGEDSIKSKVVVVSKVRDIHWDVVRWLVIGKKGEGDLEGRWRLY